MYAPLKYVQRLAVTKKLSKTGYHIALRKNLQKQGLNKDIQAFQKQLFFFKTGFFMNCQNHYMKFNVVESESSKPVRSFCVWFEETGNSSHQFARILIIQEVLTKLASQSECTFQTYSARLTFLMESLTQVIHSSLSL